MTPGLSLLGSTYKLTQTLTVGRSPSYWQRQLHGKLVWLNAPASLSRWIEEFSLVDLRLCGQPLLGQTLTALTQQLAGRSGVEPERTQLAEFLPRSPSPLPLRRARVPHRDRPSPDLKVGIGNRESRVGESTTFTSWLRGAANLDEQGSGERQAHLHRIVPTAGGQDPEAHRQWSGRLLRRAARSLSQGGGDGRRNSTVLRELATVLASQWSLPLAGITAPLELLGYWGNAQRRSPAGWEPPTSKATAESPEAISAGEAIAPSPSPSPLPAPEIKPVRAGQVVQPERMPPLLSYLAKPTGEGSPLPLPTAREQTPAAIAPTEDLAELADKIKRILDEEARRHGIDV